MNELNSQSQGLNSQSQELNSKPQKLNLQTQNSNSQSQKIQRKSQNSILCKAINTWLIKQSAYKMRYPKRKYYLGCLEQCLSFFAPLIKGDEKIKAVARVYFTATKTLLKPS